MRAERLDGRRRVAQAPARGVIAERPGAGAGFSVCSTGRNVVASDSTATGADRMRLPPWILALIALVALGYAVPYLLLTGTERWSGAFLFWIAFGAAVWLLLVGRVARWNAAEKPEPRG
jgi:hypothetical protein